MKNLVVICISLIFLSACSRSFDGGYNPPLLYKIDIQQGNVIEQKMLDKLKPGMDKNQVKFIMGTPVLIDPFHNERWEYIYSFQKGGGVREQRHITLHFEDDKLAYISGDVDVSYVPRAENEIVTEEEAILVPESNTEEKGFFGRLLDKLNPLDDEDVSNVPSIENEMVTEEEVVAVPESNTEEKDSLGHLLEKSNPLDDDYDFDTPRLDDEYDFDTPRVENEIVTEEEAIVVPESDTEEKGFFGRLLDKLNPLDDGDDFDAPSVENEIVTEEEAVAVAVPESNTEEKDSLGRLLEKSNPLDEEYDFDTPRLDEEYDFDTPRLDDEYDFDTPRLDDEYDFDTPRIENEIVAKEEAVAAPESNTEEKGFFGRLLDKLNPPDDE